MIRNLIIFLLCQPSFQQEESCGRIIGNPRFAVGGKETESPWAVSIGYHKEEDEGNYHHHCTGSILSKTTIITAAHCTIDFSKRKFEIHAGKNNPRLLGVVERSINVDKVKIHPQYNAPEVYFDVALIFLDEPLVFSSRIQPICLPSEGEESSNSISFYGLKVQGWSPTKTNKLDKLILTQVAVTVGSIAECNEAYKKQVNERTLEVWMPDFLKPSQFCAGSLAGGRTSFGDSGGPAMLRRNTDGPQYVLMGIVSGGFPGTDGYYMFVAHHQVLDWIKCQMSSSDIDVDKYRDIITVSSTGVAADKQWERMGIYKRMCGVTRNGKPVWKMRGGDERYLFYTDDGYWKVGPDYTGTIGGVASVKTGQSLLGIKWKYYTNDGWKEDDDTLTVTAGEPWYPETVTISSSGKAAEEQSSRMGVYRRVEHLYQLGRPVYKQENGDNYIFCESASGHWLVGSDYTGTSGWFHSVENGRVEILGLRWKYWNGTDWLDDDDTLKVV